MNKEIAEILTNFVFELIVDEELAMARLLRKRLLNKLEKKPPDERNRTSLNMFEDILLDSSSTTSKTTKLQSSKLIPYLNSLTKYTYAYNNKLIIQYFFHNHSQ